MTNQSTKKLIQVEKSRADIYMEIEDELTKAIAKFPTWPTDPLHAVAVLNE